MNGWSNPRGLVSCLIAALLAALLAAPALAVSKKDVEEGRKQYEEITKATPVYKDPEVNEMVTRVGQLIAKHSDEPELEFTFTVLDSQDINAFATRGGFIYINLGLLAYLDSEAELAAVLAHEVAHVTERHFARQERRGTISNVASTVAAVVVGMQTGSNDAAAMVHDTASVAGAAWVMGYGRDLELEADRVGARYMHGVGYDPQAMMQLLTVLTEYENFMKRREREQGRKAVSYHGIFSTHPANDERLKEVVGAAGKLSPREMKSADPAVFRRALEDMKFSDDRSGATVIGNRYYSGKLGVTVAFPADWKIVRRSSTVLSGPNRDGTILQMLVKRAKPELGPAQFASDVLKLGALRDEKELKFDSEEMTGATGLYSSPRGGPDRRVAVIYYGSYAFVFDGRTSNASLAGFYDSMFMSAISSFRPLNDEDRDSALGIHIHYQRAPEGITFAKLAEVSPIKEYPEEMLRLINGYYPSGEPKTGEWIKVFR